MLITDQVATAPCTDRVQEWFRTFEAKLFRSKVLRAVFYNHRRASSGHNGETHKRTDAAS